MKLRVLLPTAQMALAVVSIRAEQTWMNSVVGIDRPTFLRALDSSLAIACASSTRAVPKVQLVTIRFFWCCKPFEAVSEGLLSGMGLLALADRFGTNHTGIRRIDVPVELPGPGLDHNHYQPQNRLGTGTSVLLRARSPERLEQSLYSLTAAAAAACGSAVVLSKLYPNPRTDRIYSGLVASTSIFCRSRRI